MSLLVLLALETTQKPVTSPEIFRDSPFTRCDAKVLMFAWNTVDVAAAEIEASARMAAGTRIRRDLTRGYNTFRVECTAEEAGFTPAMLATLAEKDSTLEGVQGARERIENKLDQAAYYLMEVAETPEDNEWEGPSQGAFQARYTYCDAEALAEFWQIETKVTPSGGSREAAFRIGQHVKAGRGALVERSLNHAYATARARSRTCTVEEGLYGPEHVQALATHWGLEEAATRTRIEQKLMARDRNGIESALAAAVAPVPNLQALWNGVTRRGLEAAGRPPVDCRPGHCFSGWVNAVNGRLDPVQ